MLPKNAIHTELSNFRQALPGPMPGFSWQVRRLLDVLHAELFDNALNVETLKDRCRIRDNNISCRFKQEVGISIRDCIESLRLDAARHLLERGDFNASEVGMAVGYSSLQTFYRAFERRYHCTPGHLRRCSTTPRALAS